ncbi:hypothetical protein GGX14DRAFT_670608 [Mycena pura]|uniref:Uncharacterized protein n=1 Tax=Mycena pura TaxID=153505 RepID=A0AAD6VVZ3_9AGAR|nr:hypothetical protein GGX14DRAFT_670608 [Mycena pura]
MILLSSVRRTSRFGPTSRRLRVSGTPSTLRLGSPLWGHPVSVSNINRQREFFFLQFRQVVVPALRLGPGPSREKPVALYCSPVHFDYFDKDGVSRIKWTDAGLIPPRGVIALLKEQDSPHNIFIDRLYAAAFNTFFFAGVVEGCGVKTATSNAKTYCHYYIPTRLLRQAALKNFSADVNKGTTRTLPHILGAPATLRHDGSAEAEHSLPAGLHILESDDDTILDPSHFTSDRLWIPSVDAVAVLERDRLVRMIQLTIARRHDIKEQGIAHEEIGRSWHCRTRGGERTARQPYALRVKNAPHVGNTPPVGNASTERPAPCEPFTIPVGYAGFIKADDLRTLLVDPSSPAKLSLESDSPMFDAGIEIIFAEEPMVWPEGASYPGYSLMRFGTVQVRVLKPFKL